MKNSKLHSAWRRSTILPAALSLLAPLLAAQDVGAARDIDGLVTVAMQEWRVPGMALAIVKDGKVVHQKGYGLRDFTANRPVTSKTAFGIGSITKSVTVLLMHSLAAEGKLDWDKPVRDQLPGFALKDPVASDRATPRDLVSHRTGMPRHDVMWLGTTPPSPRELLLRLRYLEPSRDFRTTYQYNNLMFMAAGMVAEHAGHAPWETLVAQRVLAPLEMNSTRDELAVGYTEKDGRPVALDVPPGLRSIAPAGALYSTIEDMTRYLLAHMNKGVLDGRRALPESFFGEMQKAHVRYPAPSPAPFEGDGAYGMGFFLQTYRGHRTVWHTGTIGGYHTMMWWMPGDKFGVIIMLNRVERQLPPYLCLTLADKLLGYPASDWMAAYKTAPPAPRKPIRIPGTSPSHALSGYSGDYVHPAYGKVGVEVKDGKLAIVRNGSTTEAAHWHYDTFSNGTTSVRFNTALDGTIAELVWNLEAAVPSIVFSRVAAR